MNNNKKSNVAIVEFKSVSRGILVTDGMIKSARVDGVFAGTLCPGRYLTIVEGEVSAVESALETADKLGGRHVISSLIVSGINLKVIEAIGGDTVSAPLESIGIIEGMQMANLISSADICVDSANVEFADFRLAQGCGANSFYIVTGTLSSVNEAVKNAAGFLKKYGSLEAYKIIPNPDRQVWKWLRTSLSKCC